MNIDPLLESVGLKKTHSKPNWLEQFARQKGVVADPDDREWWKNMFASPVSTIASEYGAATALLPYNKLIERPAFNEKWQAGGQSAQKQVEQLKHLAKKLGIKVVPPRNGPAVLGSTNDSMAVHDAAKKYYTPKGDLKWDWKKFTLRDILAPDKWFTRHSIRPPSKLDVSKYHSLILAADNIHPGLLAKDIGMLQQSPFMRKLRGPAEVLGILGQGAPVASNDEGLAQKLTIAGTVAQLPLLAAEMDAMNHGSNVLKRIGASGNKAHFPYLGMPNYAASLAIPSLSYLAKKHLFGGYDQPPKAPYYDKLSQGQDSMSESIKN